MHTYRINLNFFDGREQYLLAGKTKISQNEFRGLCIKAINKGAEELTKEYHLLTIGLGDVVKRAVEILEKKYGYKRLESVAKIITCDIEGPRGHFTQDTRNSKPQ